MLPFMSAAVALGEQSWALRAGPLLPVSAQALPLPITPA
jgi:hypothetical protein